MAPPEGPCTGPAGPAASAPSLDAAQHVVVYVDSGSDHEADSDGGGGAPTSGALEMRMRKGPGGGYSGYSGAPLGRPGRKHVRRDAEVLRQGRDKVAGAGGSPSGDSVPEPVGKQQKLSQPTLSSYFLKQ